MRHKILNNINNYPSFGVLGNMLRGFCLHQRNKQNRKYMTLLRHCGQSKISCYYCGEILNCVIVQIGSEPSEY
jgi:hypothetical protein